MNGTEKSDRPLTEAEGQVLIRLARQAIGGRLNLAAEDSGLTEALKNPVFSRQQGTFVTLKVAGQLRGCMGNLVARESITKSVCSNGVSAAFYDPRFRPLTAEEYETITISVSVLSPSRPLEHHGGQDLITRLRAGTDGVTLRRGGCSATFLPQVWDQLPRPEEFLGHLCRKAGLPDDAWQDPDIEVSTYQVQNFKEHA